MSKIAISSCKVCHSPLAFDARLLYQGAVKHIRDDHDAASEEQQECL